MSTADGSRIVGAIRIVIVGGGRIGQVHAHNILMNGAGLRLTAIVEPFPTESLTSLAARADVPVASELGNWLAEADALIIALPTDMHEEVLIAAAAAGVHVLCEKPLAGDLDAARRMIAAAEKAGIVLQVGFNRRFDHNYRALRAAAANGGVGRIETVRVTSRDPGPPGIDYIRQSGGLFMDMTIHDFDMIRFLTGDEVESVFARGACLVDEAIGQAGDIDTALVTVRFKGGAIGVIENSRRASYGYDQRAEIHG
ncbi:MAG TPA: Gfo/Idh/MocA family oxidoreductase, partial [Spirochaetia bacterium]|nr:Gfo/Idh/MocA family oxidoreductase [Spirochaetia bacterium]